MAFLASYSRDSYRIKLNLSHMWVAASPHHETIQNKQKLIWGHLRATLNHTTNISTIYSHSNPYFSTKKRLYVTSFKIKHWTEKNRWTEKYILNRLLFNKLHGKKSLKKVTVGVTLYFYPPVINFFCLQKNIAFILILGVRNDIESKCRLILKIKLKLYEFPYNSFWFISSVCDHLKHICKVSKCIPLIAKIQNLLPVDMKPTHISYIGFFRN